MCNFPTAYFPTPLLWWAEKDSNLRPLGYQPSALTSWAISPYFHFFSWWRLGGSNSWPPACKAGALPAELNPHSAVLSLLKIFYKTFKIKQYLRTKTLRNVTFLVRFMVSLERRWSSRTFRYGYLVTTSPQSPVLPSATPSLRLGYGLRVPPALMVWRAVCTRPGNVFTAACWSAITSNSGFM